MIKDYSVFTKDEILIKLKNREISNYALFEICKTSSFAKEILLEMMKISGNNLNNVTSNFKDDKDIVIEAIKELWSAGRPIRFASERLRDDKDVVLEAVKRSGYRLAAASDRLKNDKDVVLEATNETIWALQYASNRLQNDKGLLEVLEKTSVGNLHPNSKKWYEERMDVLALLREKELIEKNVSPSNLKNNKIKF